MTFTEKYGNVDIRALTLKQPYCSLMAHGKDETRVWGTDIRGWVLFTASQTPYTKEQVYNICGNNYDLYMTIVEALKKDATAKLNSVAMSIGFLTGSRLMTKGDEAKCFAGYREPWIEVSKKTGKERDIRLYVHTYESVQLIQPFEWKGSLGFSKPLSEDIKQKIILL